MIFQVADGDNGRNKVVDGESGRSKNGRNDLPKLHMEKVEEM